MVCLFTSALSICKEKFQHDDDWLEFQDYNWLIHDISKYIYENSDAYNEEYYPAPHIPLNDATEWSIWFKQVFNALKNEFYDASEQHTINVLENCPTEEVALMIFETIDINIIKNYITP